MAKELRKAQKLSQLWQKSIAGMSTVRHFIVLQRGEDRYSRRVRTCVILIIS
jgi:hypothetical protein